MPPAHAAINPLLVAVMTQKPVSEVPPKPTLSQLPGTYAKLMNKHKKSVVPVHEPNKFYLVCGACGSKRQYDLGFIAFDHETYHKDSQAGTAKPLDYIQSTGYFRCKECNAAGDWEPGDKKLELSLLTWLMAATAGASEEELPNFGLGTLGTSDGVQAPRYASGTEEIYLNKLLDSEDGAYIWNRLGNIYQKGGRPELAAAAFEQSILAAPDQVESQFSLGRLLVEIGELQLAAEHLWKVLCYAKPYQGLSNEELRNLVHVTVQMLYGIHLQSEQVIPFLPTQEFLAQELSFLTEEAAAAVQLLAEPGSQLDLDKPEVFDQLTDLLLGAPPAPAAIEEAAPVKPAFSGRPVKVWVKTKEKAQQVAELSRRYGLECQIFLDYRENTAELQKAVIQKRTPSDVYSPCTCGSGSKFKFCCAKKLKQFTVEQMIQESKL